MNFSYSDRSLHYQQQLKQFMQAHIFPLEKAYTDFVQQQPWQPFPLMETLKQKAKDAGLWNLFLPPAYGDISPGLSNLEYAPLAAIMGQVIWASEVFNCSAPDTGNMEVLAKYGSPAQQERFLQPLVAGKARSAFLMTEPDVASSDATNISTRIERRGEHYRINGRKWWATGAMHPHLDFFILMGKTDPAADRHAQQSMVLIPANSPGLTILRPLRVFGDQESPIGHAEVLLQEVEVPADHLIWGEGKGFSIAQGRLGPGRIHHCMRLIGMAQRALELMCIRVTERSTFGKRLDTYSSIRQDIAQSRCDIEQARLLTLSAADAIDRQGAKAAQDLIAMIKIVAPNMACTVIDRAIQAHGALGLCQDTPLAGFWLYARALRLADGPDEVHRYQLGRKTIEAVLQQKANS